MKKNLVLFAASVAAFLAVSCAKETVNDNFAQAGMKKVTITASVDEMTKTTYSETGAFSWTKGDKVSVLGDDKVFYTLTAQESGATVEFSGEVPAGVELTGKAFYPADDLHACIEGAEWDSYEFNIPEYKDLTATFSADLPMGSYTAGDGMYSFKHMTGAALLTFSNLEDYAAIEITIANEALKLSGIFEPYTLEGLWTYGSKSAPEGGSKFIRKVAVVDGIAQVYLPYPSNLWEASTIDIVGFNAEGKEFELLTGKTMKANYDEFPRATVIPYATLIVPTYVAPEEKKELDELDWNSDIVVSPSIVASLSNAKVFADDNNIYVNMTAPSTLQWNKLYCYFGRGLSAEQSEGKVAFSWGWGSYVDEGTIFDVEGDYSEGALTVPGVETKVVVGGENVEYYLAFPRTASEILNSAGKVCLGFHLYDGSTWVGSFPKTWEYAVYALEVTLP